MIDKEAIRANIALFRRQGEVMGVVKANAYGVGSELIAPLLQECGVVALAIQEIEEAKAIRQSDCTLPLFLLSYTEEEIEGAVEEEFTIAVHDPYLIDRLQEEAKRVNKRVAVHLAIDSGMNRIGCRPEEALSIAQQIESASHLALEGVMSHFSSADCPGQDEWTRCQAERLLQVQRSLHLPWCQVANTAGASRFSFAECNLVRIGIGLYGVGPSRAVQEALPLKPALSLTSRLIEIRHCRTGEAVGYGSTYRLTKDGPIGIVPIGYADGIHMCHSNKGVVLIGGQRLPIVGLICMDSLMCDLSSLPSAKVGDEVVLFGKDLPVHEVAERVGTTPHQLITCLGARIERCIR